MKPDDNWIRVSRTESDDVFNPDNEVDIRNDFELNKRISSYHINLCFLVVVGISTLFIGLYSSGRVGFSGNISTQSKNHEEIQFTVNKLNYETLAYFQPSPSGLFKYSILDGYAGVVEPYSEMQLHIFNKDLVNYYYTYEICDVNGKATENCVTRNYNDTFHYNCQALNDQFEITVRKFENSTGKLRVKTSGLLLCMYVRREIRNLTASDLQMTMDTMAVMWNIEEGHVGRELYGPDFHNYKYLLDFHYFMAAWQDADHAHEGTGFLAQHVKMANIFEKSLQAVNPSVALPYWDFTIESSMDIKVWDSPIFTEDTFGSLQRPHDEFWGWTYRNDSVSYAAILNGRWERLLAARNERFQELNTGYSYMRSPWNMNPSKYISRFTSMDKDLPSCASHYELLATNDIKEFLRIISHDAHASTHGVIGGVYGCDVFDSLRLQGYINDEVGQKNLCKNFVFYIKDFYRQNLIKPRSGCVSVSPVTGYFSTEWDAQNCGFECPDERLVDLKAYLETDVLNQDHDCVPSAKDMPQDGWDAWIDFLCHGDAFKIFAGDQLESASPADPSFWPIHPTLERLLQAKHMAGGFLISDWGTNLTTDYVCDRPSCYDYETGIYGQHDSCCYGHFFDDRMYDAPNANRSNYDGTTNAEIHDWTNPTWNMYKMPYIYDKFEWSHCLEYDGLDFEQLLTKLYLNVTSSY